MINKKEILEAVSEGEKAFKEWEIKESRLYPTNPYKETSGSAIFHNAWEVGWKNQAAIRTLLRSWNIE